MNKTSKEILKVIEYGGSLFQDCPNEIKEKLNEVLNELSTLYYEKKMKEEKEELIGRFRIGRGGTEFVIIDEATPIFENDKWNGMWRIKSSHILYTCPYGKSQMITLQGKETFVSDFETICHSSYTHSPITEGDTVKIIRNAINDIENITKNLFKKNDK